MLLQVCSFTSASTYWLSYFLTANLFYIEINKRFHHYQQLSCVVGVSIYGGYWPCWKCLHWYQRHYWRHPKSATKIKKSRLTKTRFLFCFLLDICCIFHTFHSCFFPARCPSKSGNHFNRAGLNTYIDEWFKFELDCLYLLAELFIDKLATETFHSSNQIGWLIMSTVIYACPRL